MISKSINFKIVLGILYLTILSATLITLFYFVDFKDLTSYEFIRKNEEILSNFSKKNFLLTAISYFLFGIFWTLLLGFGSPVALIGGFVLGKWWGTLILVLSNTIGATLLYILASIFFSKFIENKFAKKFSKFKKFFNKNELTYFMFFRFVGGGGTPFPIQNIIPVIFNMKIKNYFLATLVGTMPASFVAVALGEGIKNIINKEEEISFFSVLTSSEIYLPILGFLIILLIAYIVKKLYFKN